MVMPGVCSGCGKPPHAGGCRVAFSEPPPPSAEELQRRRDYLASPEFLRERDASMAGRNPRTEPDLTEEVRRAKARADGFQANASLAWEKVEKACVLLREKDEALDAARRERDALQALADKATCSWCGHVGPKTGIEAHVLECDKRPEAQLLDRLILAEEAIAAARRDVETLRNALGAAHDHAHAAGCRGYLGEDFFARIRAAIDGSAI